MTLAIVLLCIAGLLVLLSVCKLAVGAGSLLFSHVNDAGLWMFKECVNLSVKDTLRSWSVMEALVSVTGLAGVLLLNQVLHF
jgi:Gnt-I system high-affinity gluconate transporter